MTSSCIRLVWQPIQHKDRQRAESGETDSWVAANRQGGPTKLDEIKNLYDLVQARGVERGWHRYIRLQAISAIEDIAVVS